MHIFEGLTSLEKRVRLVLVVPGAVPIPEQDSNVHINVLVMLRLSVRLSSCELLSSAAEEVDVICFVGDVEKLPVPVKGVLVAIIV